MSRCFVDENQINWHERSFDAKVAYNSAPHSPTTFIRTVEPWVLFATFCSTMDGRAIIALMMTVQPIGLPRRFPGPLSLRLNIFHVFFSCCHVLVLIFHPVI
jgi:hypothetical protein